MMRKPFLAACALGAGLFAVLYLAFGAGRPIALTPWKDPPRPGVSADPKTAPVTLSGLFDARPTDPRELRLLRNRLVGEHAAALAEWRAGRKPLREVEAIEMDVQVARRAVGEIDAREMHARLAELFAREVERLEKLRELGVAGEDQVRQANLYVARERHAAGLPVEGPDGQDYEAMRKAYLDEVKRLHETRVELGIGNREALELEYDTLEREFPPTDEAESAK